MKRQRKHCSNVCFCIIKTRTISQGYWIKDKLARIKIVAGWSTLPCLLATLYCHEKAGPSSIFLPPVSAKILNLPQNFTPFTLPCKLTKSSYHIYLLLSPTNTSATLQHDVLLPFSPSLIAATPLPNDIYNALNFLPLPSTRFCHLATSRYPLYFVCNLTIFF